MATVTTARSSYDENKFPGPPANFVHESGDWETYDSTTPLCKDLTFASTVPKSAVSKFSCLGYRNRSLFLRLELNSELEGPEIAKIERYLGEDLFADSCGTCTITAKTRPQFRRVYSFLTEDNTLTSEKYSNILNLYRLNPILTKDEVQLEEGFEADKPVHPLKMRPGTRGMEPSWGFNGLQ